MSSYSEKLWINCVHAGVLWGCMGTPVSSRTRKCCHFDEIFITACTGSCQFDNPWCNRSRKVRQNDISVSVIASCDNPSPKPNMILITDLYVCLFVCFITKSFLTYLFFFHLRLLYQPYLGICQAPCVQSHQRQPMSAVAITACEVQVSATDSQTVPTVVTGVSKPLCCRLTLTFTLTSENLSLCTTLLLLLLLVLIQLCSPRCWHLDSNCCRTRCRQS